MSASHELSRTAKRKLNQVLKEDTVQGNFMKMFISICVCLTSFIGHAEAASAPKTIKVVAVDLDSLIRIDRIDPIKELAYKYPDPFVWGDCSWVSDVALAAGWHQKHLPDLLMIVARESGCCPNRKGGDKVDRNCRITGVSEWNHRSDTGLTQLNGVHWLESHKYYAGLFCKREKICTQEPLLDPFTNLRMAKLLFDVVGWSAWNLQG